MDLGGVDVAELVEVERRFVAEDTLHAIRPEGCLAVAVQCMHGERVQAVEPESLPLQRSPARHLRQPLWADARPPGVIHGQEAVVILGDLVQRLEVPARH